MNTLPINYKNKYTIICLAICDIKMHDIVQIFLNDNLIYDYDDKKYLYNISKIYYTPNIQQLAGLVQFDCDIIGKRIIKIQKKLIIKLLSLYDVEQNNNNKTIISYQVENRLLDFILNLHIAFGNPIIFRYLFLKILNIDNLQITEEQFYKLYFLNYVNFLKPGFGNISYSSNINYIGQIDFKYVNKETHKFNLLKILPNNFSNILKMLKHIINFDDIQLFDSIKNKIIINNDDIIYDILNSTLISKNISTLIIKYLLYNFKFELNLDKIKILNNIYELINFEDSIGYEPRFIGYTDECCDANGHKYKYFIKNNKHQYPKLLEITTVNLKILCKSKLNVNHIINLLKNYIIYDFSKIELTDLELEKIYFEFFCIFSQLNYNSKKNIISKFEKYTNNAKLILREMYKYSKLEDIKIFMGKHNLKPDRYCILNALMNNTNSFYLQIDMLENLENNQDIFKICDNLVYFPKNIFNTYDKRNIQEIIMKYYLTDYDKLWRLFN